MLLAKTADQLPVAQLSPRLTDSEQLIRTPGVAVYLSIDAEVTPVALLANIEQNHLLQRRVVLITVVTCDLPNVERIDVHRIDVHRIGHGISSVEVHLGYHRPLRLPALLAEAVRTHAGEFGQLDPDRVLYTCRRPHRIPRRAARCRAGSNSCSSRSTDSARTCRTTSTFLETGRW